MVVDKLYEFMFHHQIFLQLPYNIFISIKDIRKIWYGYGSCIRD